MQKSFLNIKKIGLVLAYLCLSILIFAREVKAVARLSLVEKVGKEEKLTVLSWALSQKAVFQGPDGDNTSQARVLYYAYNIVIPLELGIVNAEASDAITKFEGNSLIVSSLAVKQYVKLISRKNEQKTILIENHFSGNPPIEIDGCNPNHPTLSVEKNNQPPFAIGYACINRPNQSRAVTLSLPNEVSIVSSSFFDLLGKGERWRLYELPDAGAGGALGSVDIVYEKKNYRLFIVAKDINVEAQQKRLAELEEENNRLKSELNVATGLTGAYQKILSLFTLYIGVGSNAMTAKFPELEGASTYADSELSAYAQAQTKPFFYNLYGRMDFNGTLPVSTKETRQDMYQGRMFWGYKVEPISDFSFTPGIALLMTDFSQKSRNFRIQSGHFGFGLDLNYKLGKNYFALEYMNASAGSLVIKDHNSTAFNYRRQLGTDKLWWLGIKYQAQKFNGVTTTGEKRAITENKILLYVGI